MAAKYVVHMHVCVNAYEIYFLHIHAQKVKVTL